MRNTLKAAHVACLLIGTSTFAAAMPAMAQDSSDGAAIKLDEIVVTAQKREQNLQDIPLAVSAISADTVEKLGIKDSRDLSGLAPNVTITQGTTSNNAAVISIRGIPTPAAETFGFDTSNGLYVDGVYIARSGGSALDVMDIARVEVLRGPQGTLFGRNTTGGAIAFISRAPSKAFKLSAEAGYGNYNAWNGRISLDPGEIAGIATSFSYSHRQRNGVVDNINEPNDSLDPGARKTDAARFAAKADIGGTGSIQYIFDWSKTNGSPINIQLTNVWDGSTRAPVIVGGESLNIVAPAPVAPYLDTVTFTNPACEALAAPTREWRNQVCNDITSRSMDETWGHNLQVQNDFGPFSFKSTTGYRQWNNDSVTDLDGIGEFSGPAFTSASLFNGLPSAVVLGIAAQMPAGAAKDQLIANAPYFPYLTVPTITGQGLFDTSNQRRHKQFSQEVELSGKNDNLDWVLGGFYFWETGSENNPQNTGFVIDTASYIGTTGNPARYRLMQVQGVLQYSATSESKAVLTGPH